MSVRTADFMLRLLRWLIFLGGAFGSGLTNSGENALVEIVARGLWDVDVEATGSLSSLFRTGI